MVYLTHIYKGEGEGEGEGEGGGEDYKCKNSSKYRVVHICPALSKAKLSSDI